ncbi:hypothetical protein ACN28I_10325 [Archangium gephyra]
MKRTRPSRVSNKVMRMGRSSKTLLESMVTTPATPRSRPSFAKHSGLP